jgi:hypothetical protein
MANIEIVLYKKRRRASSKPRKWSLMLSSQLLSLPENKGTDTQSAIAVGRRFWMVLWKASK